MRAPELYAVEQRKTHTLFLSGSVYIYIPLSFSAFHLLVHSLPFTHRNHLYQFLSLSVSVSVSLSCVHLPVSNCLILERLIKASLSLSHHHFLMLPSLSVSLSLSLVGPWVRWISAESINRLARIDGSLWPYLHILLIKKEGGEARGRRGKRAGRAVSFLALRGLVN